MAYRHDDDLQFLAHCTDEELGDLIYYLTHDKGGETRWTEELTGTSAYKTHYPRHSQYWQEIAAEVQCFDRNIIATVFRGGKLNIQDVQVNRGQCLGSSGNPKRPYPLPFGKTQTYPYMIYNGVNRANYVCYIIEIIVKTDQGDWTFNP